MATKIGDLPWVKDGIGRGEFNAFRGLIHLADAGHLVKIIEEPWVVEGRNFPALESLWFLAVNNPEGLSKIMSHPTISDDISDQEAKIVAALHPYLEPDQLDKLLDPEQATLEERTITLPLAGETHLSIVRTRQGADGTMDLLERAVRSIEEFMGLPFPRRQAIYLFEEGASGGSAARNLGTRVVILVDEQTLSGEQMLGLLAHETSHYYWSSGTFWINEGAATFMESVVNNALHSRLDQPPCFLARSIAELEALKIDPLTFRDDFRCNYSLGERVFRDLYRNMDDTTFRLAFRRLYLHTEFNIPDDECDDHRKTICPVQETFTAYTSEETAATVEKVIARWHDRTEPYDLSDIDDTPVEADIAAISGRIEGAYLSYSIGGLPVSAVTLEPNRTSILYLNLDYSYRDSSGLESLPIETAVYFEDGFEFLRKRTDMPVPGESTRLNHHVQIYDANGLGRYWVHVYWGEQKIAEVTFETVPTSGPHSIRGMVTFPDGWPLDRIALEATRGEEEFSVYAGPDGVFDVVVSSGIFFLKVYVVVGNEWHFMGWYDGGGGITIDPGRAFEVIVDGAVVEDIDISLSSVSDANIRGVVTGPDGQPIEGIALEAKRGEERFWVDIGPLGIFNFAVPPGSFILEVNVEVGSGHVFVGWYDGNGSITTDPSHAFEVIVDDTNVHDIAIMLPSATEELLCPSGYFRSTRTGRCTEI